MHTFTHTTARALFASLLTGLVGLAAVGCAGAAADDAGASEEAQTAASGPVTASATNIVRSTWGYAASVPFAQLTTEAQASVRAAVPVDAVGAVVTEKFPFRATASYVGKYAGVRLFAIAAHVESRGVKAIVLGQPSGSPFSVAVAPKAVFVSKPNGDGALHSDVALLAAKDADLDAATKARLDALATAPWSFRPMKEVAKKVKQDHDASAGFFFVGRQSLPAAQGAIAKTPLAWGAAGASWADTNARTVAEADANKDDHDVTATPDRPKQVGDLLVATKFDVQANGNTKATFDPDGLTLGGDSDPFLAADSGWKPVSIAGNYLGVGRASGSPVFARFGDKAVVVGINWTAGIPEDTTKIHPNPLTSPTRAFGDVREETTANGGLRLVLHETAPYSFAATIESAAADLRATIASTTDASIKAALEAFGQASDL